MNKLFKCLSTAVLGIAMAVGVGVGLASSKGVEEVGASSPITVLWTSFGINSTLSPKSESTSGLNISISNVSNSGVSKNGTIQNTIATEGSITQIKVNGAKTGSSKTDGSFEVYGGTISSSINNLIGSASGLSSAAQNIEISFTGSYTFFKILVGSSRTLIFTSLEIGFSSGSTKTLKSITGLNGTISGYAGDDDWDYSDLTPLGTLSDDESKTVDISDYVTLSASPTPKSLSVGAQEVTVTVTSKSGSVAAQNFPKTATVSEKPLEDTKTSFDAITGTMLDGKVSFAATKGNGTVAPVISSNKIRIYKASSGYSYGGILTISSEEFLLIEITLKTNRQSGLKYSINGGDISSSAISGTGSSPFTQTLDDELVGKDVTTVSFYNVYSDSNDISYIYVKCIKKETITPTKAEVSLVNGQGSYYNGSAKNSKFSTDHIVVKTMNDDGKVAMTYSGGIGFAVTINGVTVEPTEAPLTISFEGVNAGQYEISVTVKGVGAEGADVNNSTQDPMPCVTVIAKEPTEGSFKFKQGSEAQTSFVSHIDSFEIKGEVEVAYNDGTASASSEPLLIEVLDSTSTVLYTTKDIQPAIKGSDLKNNGLIVDSGLSFVDEDSTVLKYNSNTTFTVRISLKNFTDNNSFTYSVTVYAISLSAIDTSEQTYYKGGHYDMSATVKATYDTDKTVILSDDTYVINGGEQFAPTEVGEQNISVALVNDSNKTTTYVVTVVAPSTPDSLVINLASDYKAGANFHLAGKAKVTFKGMSDPQDVEPDASEISYKVVSTSSTSFDDESAIEISTKSPMHLTYVNKYVVARYTMGEKHVDSAAQLIIAVANATVEDYKPAELGDYVKVTSVLTDYSGDYLIVFQGTIGTGGTAKNVQVAMPGNSATPGAGQAGFDISDYINGNVIEANDTTNALKITISKVDKGYTVRTSSVYIGSKKTSTNGIEYTESLTEANIADFTNTFTFENGELKMCGCFSTNILHFNNTAGPSGEMFRFYKNGGQKSVEYYKRATTEPVGETVSYLKSVIDAYRLNNEEKGGLSICNAETGIYSTEDWTKAKAVFQSLDIQSSEYLELKNTQDRFGELGKSYVDTYNKLIEAEPNPASGLGVLAKLADGSNTPIVVIVITSIFAVTVIGGYFFIRRRKETN